MPKTQKKTPILREALEAFDLKIYKEWMKNCAPLLWSFFKSYSKKRQMAQMCKTICDRTDLLGTEAHKKAVRWLSENNTKGGIF